ncbi:MAG: hypothetical protein R3244_11500, partial [Thermoanaerobaculia bacterium]|nr:hypothetical protein [Thermoanaerobaculia bacterium]
MPAYQTVTARAPGKLILMGEHAAVYGRPALVAALGLYSRATIRFEEPAAGADDRHRPVSWDLPDIDRAGRADWAALIENAARFRRAWERQMGDEWATDEQLSDAATPQPRTGRAASSELERLRRSDPARIVKLALAEALSAEELDLPATAVRVQSEVPVGAGF